MAMLKNLFALMTLLAVAVALLPRATFAGSPNCAKGMSDACGAELFQLIVLADTFTPTKDCCQELVKAGKNCHDQFVKLIISTHKPLRGTKSDVYRRSNETWNSCAAVASPSELAH